jgi:hypothetical protein
LGEQKNINSFSMKIGALPPMGLRLEGPTPKKKGWNDDSKVF